MRFGSELLAVRAEREFAFSERVQGLVFGAEVNLEHGFVGGIKVGEGNKLRGGGFEPVPALGCQLAFVGKISLAGELVLGIGGAIVACLMAEQRGDFVGFHYFRHAFSAAISAGHRGQQQARQDGQDTDDAQQLD